MINILPYNHTKSIKRLRALRIGIVTVWAFILFVIVAALLLLPLLITIDSRFIIAQKQISILEKSGAVVNPVDVASIEDQVKVLSNKLAGALPTPPMEYVGLISNSSKVGVTLSGFLMENGTVSKLEVSGIATTREALQRFIALLEKDERVSKVESPVSNFVKNTNSSFRVTITFK